MLSTYPLPNKPNFDLPHVYNFPDLSIAADTLDLQVTNTTSYIGTNYGEYYVIELPIPNYPKLFHPLYIYILYPSI